MSENTAHKDTRHGTVLDLLLTYQIPNILSASLVQNARGCDSCESEGRHFINLRGFALRTCQ